MLIVVCKLTSSAAIIKCIEKGFSLTFSFYVPLRILELLCVCILPLSVAFGSFHVRLTARRVLDPLLPVSILGRSLKLDHCNKERKIIVLLSLQRLCTCESVRETVS